MQPGLRHWCQKLLATFSEWIPTGKKWQTEIWCRTTENDHTSSSVEQTGSGCILPCQVAVGSLLLLQSKPHLKLLLFCLFLHRQPKLKLWFHLNIYFTPISQVNSITERELKLPWSTFFRSKAIYLCTGNQLCN